MTEIYIFKLVAHNKDFHTIHFSATNTVVEEFHTRELLAKLLSTVFNPQTVEGRGSKFFST